MKRLFVFTYPKLTLYFFAIALAYFVFQIPLIADFVYRLDNLFLVAIFFAGFLYSAGFTTPLATGFFLSLNVSSYLRYALIAGIGALFADLAIFSFIRISFMDEFEKLEHTSFIRHFISFFHKFPKKLRVFFVYFFAILIIASPLPDEIAVAILAGFTKIHPYAFVFISYFAHT